MDNCIWTFINFDQRELYDISIPYITLDYKTDRGKYKKHPWQTNIQIQNKYVSTLTAAASIHAKTTKKYSILLDFGGHFGAHFSVTDRLIN